MTREETERIFNREPFDSEKSCIIIDKVSYGMTIGDLKFGNVRPGVVEATIKPGHTLEDALDELDERITAWHKRKYPHIYQPSQELKTTWQDEITGQLPTISKDAERLEIQIDNASTVDQLNTLQEAAEKNGLLSIWSHKMMKFLNSQIIKSRREAAKAEGYDDFCEAHNLPYNNECPECSTQSREFIDNLT